MQFELNHLDSYDDDSLLEELRRVAALVPCPKLSRAQFNELARVHSSTLYKRFGNWSNALRRAGLEHRFDDANVAYSKEDLRAEILALASKLGRSSITLQEFSAHTGIDGGPVRRAFGTWAGALETSGLKQSPLGKRYDDEQCFENMLSVWMHYGRPPQHDEMNQPPSQVGSKAYVRRWGTWRKALAAFAHRANRDPNEDPQDPRVVPPGEMPPVQQRPAKTNQGPREVPLALRYFVLRRDHFRCVTCGRSPATHVGTVLHIDHIHPWALGGATVADNLRTLCEGCNLGKGVSAA